MNNVFVYCEIEGTKVAEVSQELLTKGRKLADTLGVQLEPQEAASQDRWKSKSSPTGWIACTSLMRLDWLPIPPSPTQPCW